MKICKTLIYIFSSLIIPSVLLGAPCNSGWCDGTVVNINPNLGYPATPSSTNGGTMVTIKFLDGVTTQTYVIPSNYPTTIQNALLATLLAAFSTGSKVSINPQIGANTYWSAQSWNLEVVSVQLKK